MINYLKYRIKNLLNFNKRQLGEIQIELSKKNYEKIKNIRDAELKIFSQYGEDGIINYLLTKLNLNNKIQFVEIGTGDYEEANTRFLCESRVCKGLLIDKIEDYTHQVGHSERTDAVIEPYMSEQWFLKMEDLAKPALDAVNSGEIKPFNCTYRDPAKEAIPADIPKAIVL